MKMLSHRTSLQLCKHAIEGSARATRHGKEDPLGAHAPRPGGGGPDMKHVVGAGHCLFLLGGWWRRSLLAQPDHGGKRGPAVDGALGGSYVGEVRCRFIWGLGDSAWRPSVGIVWRPVAESGRGGCIPPTLFWPSRDLVVPGTEYAAEYKA